MPRRPSGPGDPIIEMEGVGKRFGDFVALRDVNLCVSRREVVVVIGPSGSGKSTLIRCINRLEEHDAGRIVVDGVELSDDIRNIQEIRRETGMVFQQFNLFPHLTVLDNIGSRPPGAQAAPAPCRGDGDGAAERVHIPDRRPSIPASSRAGSSSGSPSPARWQWSRR